MCRPFVGLTACVLSGVNTLKFGSYFSFLHPGCVTSSSNTSGWVQLGVGRALTKVVDLRQERSPSHADAADVRPGLPDQVTPTALNERRGSHQERCPNVL